MYRFALRPWWVLSHVLVLALVVVMVNLGLWQLRRLDEVRDRNRALAVRLAEPEVPLAQMVPDGEVDPGDVADRRVVATGRYRADEQVLVRGRSLDDSPGSWVLVPMELDDGRVLIVNRGWIANDGRFTAVPEDFAPPTGAVTASGLLQPGHERGAFGPQDPDGGRLTEMARVDLDRLDQQVDGDVLPVWLQLTTPEAGAPDPSPEPLDPPDTGDQGPHLSYAVQWFIFALIAAGGYPLILRRVARERAGLVTGVPDDDSDEEPDDAPDEAPSRPRARSAP